MTNFIIIQSWMINHLKLRGNELLFYAYVFNFCQEGKTYRINKTFLSETLNISRKGIRLIVERLKSKGFIGSDKYTYRGEDKYRCWIMAEKLPKDILESFLKSKKEEDAEKEAENGGFRKL